MSANPQVVVMERHKLPKLIVRGSILVTRSTGTRSTTKPQLTLLSIGSVYGP